jgi:hypothetical protein
MTHDTGGPNTTSVLHVPAMRCEMPALQFWSRSTPRSAQSDHVGKRDAVPAWRPVAPTTVCEVGYVLLDLLVAGMTRLTYVQRTSVTHIGSGG